MAKATPKVKSCDTCAYQKGIAINASGATNAQIVLVGEAPSPADMRQRMPFMGQQGAVLEQTLRQAGLTREQCYITYAVKCMTYPITTPKSYEVACCNDRLHKELAELKPRVVVALGKVAMKALLDKTGSLSDIRGSISIPDWLNAPVLVTYHPSAILRTQKLRRELDADMRKVAALASGNAQVLVKDAIKINYGVLSDRDSLMNYFNTTARVKDVAIDVENASDGSLLCLGISHEHGKAVVLDEQALKYVEEINAWIKDKNSIGHNFKSDTRKMWRHGISNTRIGEDTMYQSYVTDSTIGGHGLKHLVREKLDYQEPYADTTEKFKTHMEDCPKDDLYKYNAMDAGFTLILRDYYRQNMSVDDARVLNTLFYPGGNVLAKMEYLGAMVDVPYLNRLKERVGGELEVITKEMYRAAGVTFNPNSSAQVQHILYSRLGLPVPGKLSADKEALKMLREICPERYFPKILGMYNERNKFYGTYIMGLLHAADQNHRVSANFNLHTTATGRLSSSDPVNLQNLTRGSEARNIFMATPGWQLIECDLSAAEVRGWCWLSKDEVLRHALSSKDAHKQTASLMRGIPVEEVTKAMRQDAKKITFGTIYGMTPSGLAKDLGTTKKDAAEKQAMFFGAYTVAKQWLDDIVRQVRRDMFYKTWFGRTLRFTQTPNLANQAMNYPVQNLASDITLSALIRIQYRIDRGDFGNTRLLITVHDSIMLETTEDAIAVAREVKREMERDVLDGWIPFKADVKIGPKWGTMKEYDEKELGLVA